MDVLSAMLDIILLWSNDSFLFYDGLNQRQNNLSYEKLKLIMLDSGSSPSFVNEFCIKKLLT